ncbi:MAG: phytanoyl-CoA dioxygenase family protein [Myxococcales bacterium]|nr:phytanoyl-CoA dioxygenase family protein [Myxococcales bacterium]
MALSAEQRERYWQDGCLLIPGLFPRATLQRLETRFLELVTGRIPRPESMVVMRDIAFVKGTQQAESPVHEVNKILGFEDDEVLYSHSLYPALLSAVRDLLGAELMTLTTNVFNKPPGIDGRHPLHQDLRYFTLRPEDGIVATWTAIDATNRENGCLCVIPASHREGLYEHGDPDWPEFNSGFFAARGVDLERRRHLEMQAGDTLLFHPLLVHGSGRNRSQRFRRAISTHYASAGCRRPPGKRKRDPMMRRIPDPAP